MNYLLDTHTFIWFDHDQNQLSSRAFEICSEIETTLYISMVSIWEIQIKVTLGKLELPLSLQQMISHQVQSNDVKLLNIFDYHIYRTDTLAFHHRDPFDRLLIAQALEEDMTILSKDEVFTEYNVPVVWN